MHYIRTKERTKTGAVLSPCQVRYICDDIFPSTNEILSEIGGEIDNLYKYLREINYPHVSLLQSKENASVSSSNKISRLYTETNKDGEIKKDFSSDCHKNEEAILFSEEHRKARNIADEQKMMVAIAYSSPFQIQQAKLFPSVFHIDVTADTNKEDRPLCTITAKDLHAKFFTVVQYFLPNKKAWSFKWFFQSAVPFLVTEETLENCVYVITDGDQRMIQQLEDCIREYMPWAKRGRCSWHIIDRGWATHVKFPLDGNSRIKREKAPKERSLPSLVNIRRASKKEKAQGMPQWLQVEASSPQQVNQLLRRLQLCRTMNILIVKHRRPLKQTIHGLTLQTVGSTIRLLLRPCLGLRTNHGMRDTAL